jgi:hypothetical protein
VALDQNLTPPLPREATASAIENELPAYRAISPHAVLALLCGLLAILSFTSWFFLVFAVGAIGLGVLAERKIRRDPEIWTGRGLAQAGAALGLVFGLSAITNDLVQDFLRSRAASSFSKQYASVVKRGSVEDAMFYAMTPAGRAGKKPAELYKEFKEHSDPRGMETSAYATIEKMKRRVDASPDEDVHFVKLEGHGVEGLVQFATALFELHGPGNKEFPEKEQHALLLIKGTTVGKKTEWFIEDVKYPYQPSTYVHQEKKVDDGHVHTH